MNVARFNFSHGDHPSHFATLERLRTACASRPGSKVAVLLDTKGPEIRTGVIDPSLGKLKLVKGEKIEVGTDYEKLCTPAYLACSYKSISQSVKPGSSILIADGSLMLKVIECKTNSVIAEILNNCTLGDKKNMNLPGAVVDLPTLTEKDIDDLQNFGVKHGVDFIAASFVRKGSDLDFIRSVLGEKGANIKIISKIENQEGLENYDEILAKTDGIMVARGDLGMEIPLQKVFLAQKMMIGKANLAGKPVVTATQMLESMITNPRPTRAECADVANAVLDGTDVVMLSGETANGDFGVEAVTIMGATCCEAESIMEYQEIYRSIKRKCQRVDVAMSGGESLASSAVKTSFDMLAKAIIVVDGTGKLSALVAKYRPACRILVATGDDQVARQIQGYMSSVAANVVTIADGDKAIAEAIKEATAKGYCVKGDSIVSISEYVKIHTV